MPEVGGEQNLQEDNHGSQKVGRLLLQLYSFTVRETVRDRPRGTYVVRFSKSLTSRLGWRTTDGFAKVLSPHRAARAREGGGPAANERGTQPHKRSGCAGCFLLLPFYYDRRKEGTRATSRSSMSTSARRRLLRDFKRYVSVKSQRRNERRTEGWKDLPQARLLSFPLFAPAKPVRMVSFCSAHSSIAILLSSVSLSILAREILALGNAWCCFPNSSAAAVQRSLSGTRSPCFSVSVTNAVCKMILLPA